MNKLFLLIIIPLLVFWLCMGFYLFTSIAKADRLEVEIPTQKNKQTDLFDSSIDNFADFTNKLEHGKQGGIDSMGGEGGSPQGLKYITKKSKSELEGESSKLESINENDLASKGREELIKDDTLNKIYRDPKRPGEKQHLKDAKTIAEAQDKLLDSILAQLKDLGVDCKTVKGDKKVEPEYFLQTRTSNHKDTIYNQTFCEELRNSYNCRDTLTAKCIRTGTRYKDPVPRTIRFNGHWLHHNKMNWGWAVKWKKKRWGWHITSHHPGGWEGGEDYQIDSPWRQNPAAIIADARAHIASHLGLPLEQIGEHVDFPGRGIGNINSVGCRWRVAWDEYEFGYTYREPYQVCEQWSEDWTERCGIK